MDIKVSESIGESFGEPIKEIFTLIGKLKLLQEDEEVTFDLSDCKFIHPFVFVALKLIHNHCVSLGYQVKFDINCKDSSVNNYISTVKFPECLKPDDYSSNLIEGYLDKSYLPLVAYDVISSNKEHTKSFNLISFVDNLLKRQPSIPKNILWGIRYLIDEAQDNVREHSFSTDGYIIAQFFRKAGFLDLCIADEGIGILGSYQRNGNYPNITDDMEALKYAVEGESTKGKERGYGISTSIELLTKGLQGNYFLWSGKAFYYSDNDKSKKRVYKVPSLPITKLGGTILCLRIPISENPKFNHNNYTE